MLTRLLAAVPLICCTFFASAQTKTVAAIKTSVIPKIDGNLDDAAWQNAPVANDFVQFFPTAGGVPSNKTEVKILYDNNAVYIGAYLYDDPSLIRRQLTARDGENRQDIDHFSVFFDTYNDEQNGFQFTVTAANVQSDAKLSGSGNVGFGDYGDRTWDAVWQSKASIKKDGWVVEMRIPYISLRFSKNPVQTWGLQFARSTRRTNATDFWSPVSPAIAGFVNQFGKFTELKDVQPPLRLSFSPYVSGGIRYNPAGSAVGTEKFASGGMDVKYGINESFTLDATLIPDFGQVISDNVINNLTPYEQRFTENRPFFTEGTELFNKSGLFYSRRIGARPSDFGRVNALYGSPSSKYEIIKNPSLTKLYNALKISGRTQKKLGIGFFNAVAKSMEAELRNSNTKNDTAIQTEPLTNYNIVVVDKAFKGRSSITFTNASTIRNGAGADANVSSFDWALFNKKSTHAVSGTARYSKTFGYRPYRSNYFMNTDTTTINGRRYLKPYDGFSSRLRLAKVGGKLRYTGQVNIESAKYDPNDLGYIDAPNEVVYTTGLSFNEFEPKGNFLNYSYGINVRTQYLFQPYKFSQVEIQSYGSWIFKNFWDIRLILAGQPGWNVDPFELQTKGYYIKKPAFWMAAVEGSSDSRKKLFGSYEFQYENGDLDYGFTRADLGLRYRFSNKLTADVAYERSLEKRQIGWSFLRESNGAPIAAFRDSKETTTVLSGTYNFTARMNLSVRARHYWNKVDYLEFINVDAKGNHIPRAFIDDMDENFNLFNVDAFFTWDFRYGSRIIAGWKNFLGNDYLESNDVNRFRNYHKNLSETFNLPHGNELSLRFIYFLDYNQLRKKK